MWIRNLVVLGCSLALFGCGGGGGDVPAAPIAAPPANVTCSVDAQKDWLRSYMQDSYLWAGVSPNPAPQGYATVSSYFDALRFPGAGVVPADRWSYISDAASYTQFFTEGRTLGYGVSVNGLEQRLPLKVRYVEAQSPAAAVAAGVVRGDEIVSINGRLAADLVLANDFTALSPTKEGDTVVLVIRNASGTRSLTLTAATYALTPVPISRVITLPNGNKVGYLVLKDFITQAEVPLAQAFSDFRTAGATDVILDLRYNGGGRISTANVLASLVAGSTQNGNVFTRLIFNGKQAAQNTTYSLSTQAAGFARAVVITGMRTCSASELIVNGLKPHLREVVTVGATTCGKPFGFVPVTSCASTFNVVNFEAVNALGAGQYYDGIAANCPATDDFTGQLGDPAEALTTVANSYLQNGVCPAIAGAGNARMLTAIRRANTVLSEPGERRGMWAD